MICTVVVENDSWNTCNIDVENAFFPLSPDGEWVVVIKAADRNASWWTESQSNTFESPSFIIEVYDEIEGESRDPPRWVLTTISAILLLSLLIATFLEYLKRERVD